MRSTRTTSLAVLAAALLALGACAAPGGPGAPTATSGPSSATTEAAVVQPVAEETSTPEPEPSLTAEDLEVMAFMGTIQDAGVRYPSEDQAVMVGRMACHLLDEGATAMGLAMEVVEATEPVVPGFDNDDLPPLYGAAIGSMCQQHMWQLGL